MFLGTNLVKQNSIQQSIEINQNNAIFTGIALKLSDLKIHNIKLCNKYSYAAGGASGCRLVGTPFPEAGTGRARPFR